MKTVFLRGFIIALSPVADLCKTCLMWTKHIVNANSRTHKKNNFILFICVFLCAVIYDYPAVFCFVCDSYFK